MTRRRDDDGSNVAEFVLVTLLVLFLFLVVAQVGLVLHARNVLVAAAAEGARYGANADRTDEDGAARAVEVARQGLPGAGPPEARALPRAGGGQLVDVELTAALPTVLLHVGPLRLTVHAHALKEGA